MLIENTSDWKIGIGTIFRFGYKVYIPTPDLSTRADVLRVHLSGVLHDLTREDMLEVAARTDGLVNVFNCSCLLLIQNTIR